MVALRAKKPETIEKRLKLFLFGASGVGKTVAAIQFPNAYIIDCERGCDQDEYVALIKQSKSVIFQSVNCEEIIEEVRGLGTQKHEFKTIVIDPFTTIDQDLIARAEKKFSPGDMRVWGERDKQLRRLVNLLITLDMNVVITSHGKVEYGDAMKKIGTTYDCWKRLIYMMDLGIEIERRGTRRVGIVKKTRIKNFVDGEEFDFSYDEIKKRYGAEILERETQPINLASAEQVAELNRLVGSVKLADGITDKWLAKASVDSFDDMPSETIQKCIDYVKNVINKATAVAAD